MLFTFIFNNIPDPKLLESKLPTDHWAKEEIPIQAKLAHRICGSGAEAKNMKKTHLAMAFAVLALALPTLSFAGPVLTVSFGGTPCGSAGVCTSLSGPGVTTVNFDSGLPGSPLYTLSGSATLATGTNLPFWRAPTGDTTQFITTEAGTIDISKLPKGDIYFGLYIGSLDTYNTITFTDSLGNKTTITGATIAALSGLPADGKTSLYANFTLSGATFTDILLGSSGKIGFESDNDAFFVPQQMAEPATLSMLGVGLVALGAGLRRRVLAR
jgi:hypothetical protein